MNLICNNNPKSLFKLCIYYISKNIVQVESLRGFPSQISEQIFKTCLRMGFLDENCEQTKAALGAFVEAYSSDFVFSLKCEGLIFLSEFQEMFEVMLPPLKKLDLSGCHIGNNSSLIPRLHKLSDLKILNLRLNDLSDDGFRKLLLPMKVYEKGFDSLTDLDASGNNITLYSLSNILKIPMLRKLRITLPTNPEGYQKLMRCLTAKRCVEVDDCENSVFEDIINEGWGSPIMTNWKNKLNEFENQRKQKYKTTLKSNFYSSKSIIPKCPSVPKSSVLLKTTYDTNKTFKILDNLNTFENQNVLNDTVNFASKKRLSSLLPPDETRKKMKTFEDHKAELFDIELLNAYRSK